MIEFWSILIYSIQPFKFIDLILFKSYYVIIEFRFYLFAFDYFSLLLCW